jgi:excisionase family DNA binding protein
MSGRLLRVTDAAKMLEVDPSTIRRWIGLGLIEAVKLPSGQYRIRLEDVEKLLRRQSDQEGD